ncbi:hypothetical protein [Falsirhodobacter sp. alg1]|uniref:hypothetical protein n=1 Tax=Falsirhodobacter sp. alg1 TaxID=1472418 RepID=UPI00128EA3E3|nr:hypothetical protein [Falsirhodobacter sp. alg1]
MASHTGGEIFAPLLTNLILSPLSSKEILAAGDDVVQAAMKVVNALLDEIVKVLPDAKLAVIFPSRAEFIKAQRTQLSLVDGYSPADAGYLAETMATIGENAVALLRAQTRISTSFVNLPSFSGPAAIMTEFGMLMEGFPVGSSIDWLSINQASQLWLSELLLAKLGPNYVERNAGARLSGQVQVNALKDAMLYNYFDTLNTANAPLSRRRNPDREEARRIDIAHLERFLWKGRS